MSVTGGDSLDLRFWRRDENGDPVGGSIDGMLVRWAEQIRERQAYRKDLDLINLCLYGTRPVVGFGVRTYSLSEPGGGRPLTYNVVRSVIETLVSRVCRQKPKPWAQTSGASWSLQREAKKLTKFTEGQFQAQNVYALRRQYLTDSCVFGTSAVKCCEVDSDPVVEKTFMPELYTDDGEAKYGDPRTIMQLRTMDRVVASEMFARGERADEIRNTILHLTPPARDDNFHTFNAAKDQIDVYEGFHLPSGGDIDDSRHVVAVHGTWLVDEPWKLKDKQGKPRFPYSVLRYSNDLMGWHGTGLAELLTGKQLEINKLLFEIQRAFHMGSNFRVLVERGSRIIRQHFNNDIGGILEYTGAAPIFAVAQTVHPEKFQHLLWLIQSCFAEAGVSAMSAAGQKDPTLKSGRAQEVAMDVEDSRFAAFQQADEDMAVDIADLMVEVSRNAGKDQIVLYSGSKYSEVLKLSEIDLPRDKYVFRTDPISAFSSTPAAMMEQVESQVNSGMIPQAIGAQLMGFPDREDYDYLVNSTNDDIRWCLDKIINDGEYNPPLPICNLQAALWIAVNFYVYIRRMEDIPEERKEMVLTFESAIVDLIKAKASPMSPTPQIAAGGAFGGPAMLTPGQAPPGAPPPPPGGQPPPSGAPPGVQLQ